MEDTHGGFEGLSDAVEYYCLNPYYNGRYSWSMYQFRRQFVTSSLNPYYNGRYSWRNINNK